MEGRYPFVKNITFSIILSVLLTPGFLFYFIPIRNASVTTIILTVIVVSSIFSGCIAKFLYQPYHSFSKTKKAIIRSFYLLFSLLVLISLKGPQLYLNDNHPLIVIYAYLATFIVLLASVLVISGILLSMKENTDNKNSRWKIILYGLPHLFIWTFYIIAFYPAIFSIDSMQQWDQAHVPYFDDWHPVPHTWLIMLVTSVWDSPAAFPVAQSIILALIFGYSAYCFEKYGVNKKIIYLFLLITAVIPVTGIYVVNYWEDVMYSAGILLFSMCLFNIILSNEKWISSKLNILLFVLASYGFVFFRHNGFPAFVVTILLLFAVFRLKLWRTYIVSAFVIVLFFIIKGPVYHSLHVIPATQNEALAIPTQQIAAVVKENGKMTEEQKDFVSKILPLKVWKSNYNPYIVDPLKFDKHYKGDFIQKNKKEYFKTWLELCKQNPGIVTKAYLKESSLVWQMHLEPDTSFLPFMLRSDPENMAVQRGIQNQVINQTLTGKAQSGLIRTLQQPFYLMWRPAFYTFAILLFGFILVLKGRWKMLLAAAPVLINTAAIAVAIPAQHFRYLYPNFLLAFIMLLAASMVKEKNSKKRLTKGKEI